MEKCYCVCMDSSENDISGEFGSWLYDIYGLNEGNYFYFKNKEDAESILNLAKEHLLQVKEIVGKEMPKEKIFNNIREYYVEVCKRICDKHEIRFFGDDADKTGYQARINCDKHYMYFCNKTTSLKQNERIVDFEFVDNYLFTPLGLCPKEILPNNAPYKVISPRRKKISYITINERKDTKTEIEIK